MPYGKRAKFVHKRVESPKKFDKRSFRVVDPGRPGCLKLVTGCPIGKYDPKAKRCKVGMKVQKMILEKACYPKMRGD